MSTAFARIAALEATVAALSTTLAAHGDTVNGMATQASVDALGSSVDDLKRDVATIGADLGNPDDGAAGGVDTLNSGTGTDTTANLSGNASMLAPQPVS